MENNAVAFETPARSVPTEVDPPPVRGILLQTAGTVGRFGSGIASQKSRTTYDENKITTQYDNVVSVVFTLILELLFLSQ